MVNQKGPEFETESFVGEPNELPLRVLRAAGCRTGMDSRGNGQYSRGEPLSAAVRTARCVAQGGVHALSKTNLSPAPSTRARLVL